MARRRHLLQHDWAAQLSALAPESLLREVRRQSRPRRWPWQPKTIRDLVNDRSADLLELAAERSGELAELLAERRDEMAAALRRQSQPRRFPWQQKTARDHVDARMSDLTERAAERSAELAALAATRRDNVVQALSRQSQPRRFPWQQKTARDYVDARVATLAGQASTQRDQLARAAALRRDALMTEFERQSQPRRFPWQSKTARDLAEARVASLVGQASNRTDDLRSQADELLARADERRQELQKQIERHSQPRRFPWQAKTARDLAEERVAALVDQATNRTDDLRSQADELLARADERRQDIQRRVERESQPRRFPWQSKTTRDRAEEQVAALVDQATSRTDDLRSQADELLARADERRQELQKQLDRETRSRRFPWQSKTTRDRLEEQLRELGDQSAELRGSLMAAPAALGAAATGAVDSVRSTADSTAAAVRETASDLGKRIGDTTDNAASSVRTAAKAPAKAIGRKVESGKRTVRWSVRLAKFSFWALLFGAAVGVLYSPRSGREVRRDIRFNINKFLDMILPVE